MLQNLTSLSHRLSSAEHRRLGTPQEDFLGRTQPISPIMSSDGAATIPATPVKSATSASDIGYPNGHLGHLSPHQEEAFQQFKQVLTERELYKPGPPPSHDDPLLL